MFRSRVDNYSTPSHWSGGLHPPDSLHPPATADTRGGLYLVLADGSRSGSLCTLPPHPTPRFPSDGQSRRTRHHHPPRTSRHKLTRLETAGFALCRPLPPRPRRNPCPKRPISSFARSHINPSHTIYFYYGVRCSLVLYVRIPSTSGQTNHWHIALWRFWRATVSSF